MKLVSIVLAYVALAAAFVAVVTMLYRLGRGSKTGPASLWVHRVAGYLFVAIMAFLFAVMLHRITVFGKGLTPGVAWHGAAGFAVMAFIFFKWAVVRPFRGLMKLAPALGIVVLSLSFVVINLGATMDLLDWLGAREPAEVAVLEVVPAEGVSGPARPAEEDADRLPAARFVFADKCGKCHHLRRSFEERYAEAEWPAVIERMRRYEPAWINDAEAGEIEFYVTNDHGPGG